MKKLLILLLTIIFITSMVLMATGCNTAQIEELTNTIEEATTEKGDLEKSLADVESEALGLQEKVNGLEQDIDALKSARNLIAFIAGEDGKPLAGAKINLPEMNEEIIAGEDGVISLLDLPGDTVNFLAYAQGYLLKEESATLEQGLNGVLLSMERDPFGLLPSEVCMEGETLLYLEDFQDGMAQGWPEIEDKQDGWAVEADPDEEGNILLAAVEPTGVQMVMSDVSVEAFDNSVWRIRTKYTGSSLSLFLWKLNLENSDINHGIMFGKQTGIGGGMDMSAPSPEKWHIVEISTYNGVIELWIDGKKIASRDDIEPLPAGTIGLAFHGDETAGKFYYDEISVCNLSAPFKSIFESE